MLNGHHSLFYTIITFLRKINFLDHVVYLNCQPMHCLYNHALHSDDLFMEMLLMLALWKRSIADSINSLQQ